MEEIKKILDKHEKRIFRLEKLVNSKSVSVSISEETAVLDLINSGFFDTLKKYGEMIKELKIQARFIKNHKYKEILEKVTQENKLERKMVGHQWKYRKKL